mmetsp:Transcript_125883/g.362004  ORF Transcript_125883/g.362004 Transcript_125883/m.362004 type:complete len:218 (-) Transcript_125883:275-928(-)
MHLHHLGQIRHLSILGEVEDHGEFFLDDLRDVGHLILRERHDWVVEKRPVAVGELAVRIRAGVQLVAEGRDLLQIVRAHLVELILQLLVVLVEAFLFGLDLANVLRPAEPRREQFEVVEHLGDRSHGLFLITAGLQVVDRGSDLMHPRRLLQHHRQGSEHGTDEVPLLEALQIDDSRLEAVLGAEGDRAHGHAVLRLLPLLPDYRLHGLLEQGDRGR